MTVVAAAARTAVLEDAASAEAFDPWADRSWAGMDTALLPECAFKAPAAVTREMHSWWDLSQGWSECVGCGILERFEE